jgi:hypothetical protein
MQLKMLRTTENQLSAQSVRAKSSVSHSAKDSSVSHSAKDSSVSSKDAVKYFNLTLIKYV